MLFVCERKVDYSFNIISCHFGTDQQSCFLCVHLYFLENVLATSLQCQKTLGLIKAWFTLLFLVYFHSIDFVSLFKFLPVFFLFSNGPCPLVSLFLCLHSKAQSRLILSVPFSFRKINVNVSRVQERWILYPAPFPSCAASNAQTAAKKPP